MTEPTIAQVEAAVRAVLGGMGRGEDEAREVITGRLFSLRQAEALRAGVREVGIGPGTVVTPLARDFLKGRGIRLRLLSDAEVRRAANAGEWGFAIESESGATLALRRWLLSGAAEWRDVGTSVFDAIGWVSGSHNRGAAVLTEDAAVAAWRANGVEGIRAATVGEAQAVGRAVRGLGANLLVIEPAGKSIHELRHLLTTFRAGGAPSRPEWLIRRGPDSRAEDHADRRGDRAGHALAVASQPAERPLRDRPAHAEGRLDGGLPCAW